MSIEQVARAIKEAFDKGMIAQAEDGEFDYEPDEWQAWTHEAKAAIAAMTVQAEPVAWRYERTDGFVILVSKRYTDQHPKGDGWTETPLYAHPPAPQWQGIESAPPPPNTRVLLAWRDWRDGKWLIEAAPYETGERVGPYSNVSRHGSATHWMPLPTPPAGGSDEVR